MQRGRADLLGQTSTFRHLVLVVLGHGGVDLDRGHRSREVVDAFHGRVESAWAAEDVVGGRIGPVEADADASNAALLDFARHSCIDERAVGGQGDDQVGIAGVAGDVKDVRPEEWLAAG